MCTGFWNIQFNSLLNLEFGKRTKAIVFADDLLIAVRAENVFTFVVEVCS
jgi:hypothetical protein